MIDFSDFSKLTGAVPRPFFPAARETTFMIGGNFQVFCEIDTAVQLMQAIKYLSKNNTRYKIIGAGSNLLVPDEGVDCWVLRLGRGLRYFNEIEAGLFEVGGAMPLMQLSKELSQAGYSGLEFAAGIPASFGGAVWMNAGAHGGEISDVIEKVCFINSEGNEVELDRDQIQFSYRHTSLPPGAYIHKALIRMRTGDVQEIMQSREKNLEYRKRTQPLSKPSAGSVFRNPSREESAGSLIDRAGLKGHQIGGARISTLHGNWIINESKTATAGDVRSLIRLCIETVQDKFGIILQPEIVCW